MITFGLTGGIACGKSTACKTFEAHGIPMVDADIVARQVVESGTKGYWNIHHTFGADFFFNDGSLNRTKLGKLVFAEPKSMTALNAIMGPLIIEESARQISKLHQDGHQIVGYDAALICEMGSAAKYNPLVVVHCHRDLQIERLMTRNGLTKAEAMARIEAQFPVSQKLMMADYAIDTSGTIEDSVKQTEVIIKVMESSCR
jgi:dephospho-CoA kinase